jgi:hypothetical protein
VKAAIWITEGLFIPELVKRLSSMVTFEDVPAGVLTKATEVKVRGVGRGPRWMEMSEVHQVDSLCPVNASADFFK